MKKLICVVALGIILLHGMTALAGSVPEDMFSDNALLFFGEVVSYDAEVGTITVLPTQKIKGNVEIDAERTFNRGIFDWNEAFAAPEDTSDFPVQDEIYLMSYLDANNPLYVLRVTSTDTKTLEIKGIDHSNMMGRMQTYLNDGTYEQKEAERLSHIAESVLPSAPAPTSSEVPVQTNDAKPDANYWLYGLIGVLIVVIASGVIVYLRKKEKPGNT